MKTKFFLFGLFVAASVFMVTPCSAQCSYEATFVDPYTDPPTPISTYLVEYDGFGLPYEAFFLGDFNVNIVNTGSDTIRGRIWYKIIIKDETHQAEVRNSFVNLIWVTPNGYLAPGESVIHPNDLSFAADTTMGFTMPFRICFEIYDPATNETCDTACLLFTDCVGERVITITEDVKCQNQPYDFFGQQINQAGTYHHYDSTDNCILHYILRFTGNFNFPQPTITISGDTSFCEGGTTTLTAIADHSSYNGSTGFNLVWSNGITSPSIQVTTGGVWSVTASYNYCTASKDITITALPVPEIQLSGELQNCDGTPVELLMTSEDGVNITWSDGTTGNQFTAEQSGNYSVTVTGENGCVSSNTFEATVGFPSQSNVSKTVQCYYAINGTVYTQSGDYTYVIPNASGCNSIINLHLTVLQPWDAMIYYDTTCVWARYTQHGIDTVFVNAGDYVIPLSTIAALQLHVIECTPHIICSSEMSPCGNDTVILTVDREADSYLWNTGDTTSSITVTQAGYYSVIVTNSLGCELASDYILVGHSALLPNSPEICMGFINYRNYHMIKWLKNNVNAVAYNIYRMTDNSGRYTLLDRYQPPQGTPDERSGYSWSDIYIDNINTDQHLYTYRISALDACGRESEWSAPVSPMHLNYSIVHGDNVSLHLEWTPYIGAEVSSYRLYHDNTLRGTTTELYYDIDFLNYNSIYGEYYVEAVIDNECSYRELLESAFSITHTMPFSNRIRINSVQITENDVTPKLNVFPNPTSDVLNIQITNLSVPSATVEIFDLYGRLISRESYTEDLLRINTSDYRAGMYIIHAFTENATIGYRKFVKR